MSLTSFYRPFCTITWLAVAAIATPVLLTPAARAETAQATQQAALSDSAKSDGAKPSVPQVAGASDAAPVDPNPSQQKSLTTKAIEKVNQVAKSASDIFSRV